MCGIDYNQFLTSCCQICGDILWEQRCYKCGKELCHQCLKTATYIRQDQQVLGVNTSPLKSCTVMVFLCPQCYEEFDPTDD